MTITLNLGILKKIYQFGTETLKSNFQVFNESPLQINLTIMVNVQKVFWHFDPAKFPLYEEK